MSSTTPEGRRRAGSERQPAADRAPMQQQTPDPFASQFDEAFRELLEKLVRWEISTPEDVKFMKDELAKMTNTPAPVSALPAEAEGKGPSELDAVSNEIRPGASRAEGGGESSTSGVGSTRPDDGLHDDSCPGLGPESTATAPRKASGTRHGGSLYAHLGSQSGPSPPEVLRNLHDEAPQETPNSVRRSDAGKPEEAEGEGRDEAREEAESLAFDVVDRLDGGDPGDEYVFQEIEGCLGKVGEDGEDGVGMCHVSYKEFPGAVEDEYVLL
ncbi:hypothetical protein LZ30DRAFT_734597 [Colletotrichum cereale]|nr:hypothetical protein LZ30DRAFT_734597 [Colletotrichum cereale]